LTKIKICGITGEDEIAALNETGVDYAGFVLYEKSKRYVTVQKARQLFEKLNKGIRKGKMGGRGKCVALTAAIALAGNLIVTGDGLGSTGWWDPMTAILGPEAGKCWLDFFDLFAEGLLMPIGATGMALMLGWTRIHFLDEEVEQGSNFASKGFVHFCLKWLDPIICAILIIVSLNGFLGFTDLF